MIALGRSMRNRLAQDPDETRIPFGNRTITLPAGFTYFGQFIDHDITLDTTSRLGRQITGDHQLINHRTPELDLQGLTLARLAEA